MRTFTLALAAAATLGLAGAAVAQSNNVTFAPSTMQPAPAPQGAGDFNRLDNPDTVTDHYDLAIMLLKKKMDRMTREDGGQLTPEHQAGLQAELDKVNLRFGLKGKPGRRASFGHHEPAPGGSSAS